MIAKIARIVAVNLALLAFLLLAAEALFGAWFSSDPLDRLALARDQSVTISAGSLYPGGRDFVYRRDRWGFRGAGSDPAGYRVLSLGGSTTNQLYLEEEATWQAVAERALAERGKAVRIANAGIDGQSTIGHLANTQRWFPHVPGLKPAIVLAYVGLNDVLVGGGSIDQLRHSSWTKKVREQSAVFRLWRTVQGIWSVRRAKLNHERVDFAGAVWTDEASPTLPATFPDDYQARLVDLVVAIRAMGALPVLITQTRGDVRIGPDGRLQGLVAEAGPNGLDWQRMLEEFNARTRAVCHDSGAVCLDLAREIAFGEGDFYDHVHNTPQGAAKIGGWLADKLEPLL